LEAHSLLDVSVLHPFSTGVHVDTLHAVLELLTDLAKLVVAVWSVLELLKKRRQRK
jgi:hypothetical protein